MPKYLCVIEYNGNRGTVYHPGHEYELPADEVAEFYPTKFELIEEPSDPISDVEDDEVDSPPDDVDEIAEADDDAYPSTGTVNDVLAWVGADSERAYVALAAELKREDPRKGVVVVIQTEHGDVARSQS